MTKVILHGGYAGRENHQNDEFFKEILKDSPKESSILLVYFAKNQTEYNLLESEDRKQFENNNQGRDLSFEVASEDMFIEQVKQSDIIYLHGGTTSQLLETLRRFPEFLDEVKGKIVAGESAGAYVLSSCFYSKSEEGVFNGLSLVPVKTICHYIGENEDKLSDLDSNIETLLLADYEYKVFEV